MGISDRYTTNKRRLPPKGTRLGGLVAAELVEKIVLVSKSTALFD